LVLVPNPGYLDDDWRLDAAFKASRGIWIGRDVVFTHGPLLQWLSSLPARSVGVSTGAIYATWNTVPTWCTIVFVWLTLWLLIPEQPPWKRFLLLLLLCVFWSPSLRTSCEVLLFALFLRGGYAVIEMRVKPCAAGALAALLCATAFLLAADTGAYGVAALLIAVAGVAFEFRNDPRALRKLVFALLFTAVAFAVVAIAINAAMTRPFDFRFWRETFVMVGTYRWATPFSLKQSGAIRLLGTLLGATIIFTLRGFVRPSGPRGTTKRSGFLLGGCAFCLVLMQSALVRSDEHHIGAGLLATVFLSSAILFSFDSDRASTLGVLVALACSMFFGEVQAGISAAMENEQLAFAPGISRRLVGQLLHPLTECPQGFSEFDRACFPKDFAALQQASAGFLKDHTRLQDSIVIFPYQTRYGLAARRNVAGGLMQAYIASGAPLSQVEIAGLDRAAPPAGLYFPDTDFGHLNRAAEDLWRESDRSLMIDGITNFTRTPEVWLWLQRHYHAAQTISEGVVGLQRDDSRSARISMQTYPLGLPARTYPIRERSSDLYLGEPNWPSDADFIRLRVTVHYAIGWKLRKLERMQLEIIRADGSRELQWFVLPPNVSSLVWFYPWSRSQQASYFDVKEENWHAGLRPAIVGLRLLVAPLDWVSQRPEWTAIESADAIRLTMDR
jgi:hypothetical protein